MNADFLLEELNKLPDDRGLTLKGGSAWIRCINPEHSGGNERTPSAKINLDSSSSYLGGYYCFGCHAKHSWNELARLYGLATLDSDYEGTKGKKLGFRRSLAADQSVIKRTVFQWNPETEWRSVPGKIVCQLGGYVPKTKDALEEPPLIFPVTMMGEVLGTVRALLHNPKRDKKGKKLETSYVNSHGDWVQQTFMGYDIALKQRKKPLWIVEGPRDVAKGLMNDLRVVGLLGSTFSETRAELIRLMNPYALLIATDNDDAGNAVADDILDRCGDYMPCIRVRFPEGSDMFDQTDKKIQTYNQRVVEKYGKRR